MSLTYTEQPHPGGLKQAHLIAADFVAGQSSALTLGDDLINGNSLPQMHAAGG